MRDANSLMTENMRTVQQGGPYHFSDGSVKKGFTNLVDFQGHVLDNSFGTLTPSNPVIGQVATLGDINQLWLFRPTGSAFVLANGDDDVAAFLSYAEIASFPEVPRFGAAAIQTTQAQALTFVVKCLSSNTGIILDSVSQLALTSWAAVETTTISPITYDVSDGRDEQIWTFELLD
ncbi:hypothetical protein C8R45DRAFT_1128600 [Mycena sanguinolenta]|nr:hypothetical protein C8R45DRAFT_1128600 [Mycena sanguinolenta]